MKIKKYILTAVFLAPSVYSLSQLSDWGAWTNVGTEIKLTDKWRAGADVEYRRKGNMRQTDQVVAGADLAYGINRYVKLGLGYEFIAYKKADDAPFIYFNRYKFNVPLSYKYGRLSIGWRSRMQVDVETGKGYPDNCDFVMRNRFNLKYALPHCRINPYMRIELFHRLFSDNSPVHYKDRIAAGVEYILGSSQSFALGYMIEPKYNRAATFAANIIQAAYLYSF